MTIYGTAGIAGLQALRQITANLISQKDTNGDQALTAEESGFEQELVSKIDKNGDGVMDSHELNVFHPVNKAASGGQAPLIKLDNNSEPGESAEESNMPGESVSGVDGKCCGNTADGQIGTFNDALQNINALTLQMIASRDMDGNRTLSEEEFGGSGGNFSNIDLNGDGNLDRVELNAYLPKAIAAVQGRQNSGISVTA